MVVDQGSLVEGGGHWGVGNRAATFIAAAGAVRPSHVIPTHDPLPPPTPVCSALEASVTHQAESPLEGSAGGPPQAVGPTSPPRATTQTAQVVTCLLVSVVAV